MGSNCDQGDLLVVVDCDIDNPTPLRFVDFGREFMLEISGSQSLKGLCAELNTSTKCYELQKCDSGDDLQRFTSGNGSREGTGTPSRKAAFA